MIPFSLATRRATLRVAVSFAALPLLWTGSAGAQERIREANFKQAEKYTTQFLRPLAYTTSVSPSWIGETDKFWYRSRSSVGTRFYVVDPDARTKELLFDHYKLGALLSEATTKALDADNLSLGSAEVDDDGKQLTFTSEGFKFEYDLEKETLKKLGKAPERPGAGARGGRGGQRGRGGRGGRGGAANPSTRDYRVIAPDKKSYVFAKGHDIYYIEGVEVKKLAKAPKSTNGKVVEASVSADKKKDSITTITIKKKKEKAEGEDAKKAVGDSKSTDGAKGTNGAKSTNGANGAAGANGDDPKADDDDEIEIVMEFDEDAALQLSDGSGEEYTFAGGGRGRGRGQQQREDDEPAPRPRASVTWSDDSAAFYATRRDSRGVAELFLVDSLGQPRPKLEQYKYPMPGEPAIRKSELHVFSKATKKLIGVEPKWIDEAYENVHFVEDGHELRFLRRDRLRRNAEFCSMNPETGEIKVLLEEKTKDANLITRSARYVEETDEMIWWSERTGWGHFYLYDMDGNFKNPITYGPFRASSIVDVDPDNRLLYFRANGREQDDDNIYYEHLYRVRFDGTGLKCLDPGNATHRSSLSKSRKYVVDTCSRVDMPPRAVLRDATTGSEVMVLEESDMSALEAVGWKKPERFVVKAADGITDLYGNMWKPFDFDPNKKYPIIAHVYPGPQQEGVTHTFSATGSRQQLAQVGFIVIQVGHRGGTPNRSKAYGRYGYYNMRDYALEDKKYAIEQLAARHSFIDVERVGIYGHSGGGFFTAAALLKPPYNDFFKVGVSSAGNHDNNVYNNSWSERYHGLKPLEKKDEKQDSEKGDTDKQDTDKQDTDKQDTEKQDTEKVEKVGTTQQRTRGRGQRGRRGGQRGRRGGGDRQQTTTIEDQKKDGEQDKQKQDGEKDKQDGDKQKDGEKEKNFEIHIPTNAELAANLKGHLLLVHGEIDNNVHPAGTMRLVDALIKANKRFDMLIIPGARHGFGRAQGYFTRRMWEYFAQHLIGDIPAGADMDTRTASGR